VQRAKVKGWVYFNTLFYAFITHKVANNNRFNFDLLA